MRVSTNEEIIEYHNRLNEIVYQPVSHEKEEDIRNLLTKIFPQEPIESVEKAVKGVIEIYPSPNWPFKNSDLAECSVADINNIIDTEKFESLWEEGDYLFYYSKNAGLAGRWGWVLIDGKTLLHKHYYWECIS